MSRRLMLLVSGLLIVALIDAAAGERPWVEVASPHFRVLTDGNPAEARHVASAFEQLRYVFVDQFPTFRLESGAPLLVLAARDEETAKALEPRLWKMKGAKPAGVFHHGWEKQYVMVRLDTWGEGAHEAVYHEYTHSILHMNFHWLPLWIDEGLAEFYAYTRFLQHDIYVGAFTERYRTLLARPLFPVENLITAGYYRDEDDEQMFYAESWALVHFLTFGPGMENGKRLNQFFGAIQLGTEQKKAFRQEFGDFKEIDKGLAEYVRKSFIAARLTNLMKIEDKQFTSHTLSVAEADAELAGFHLWTHDLETARPLVEQALKRDPKLGLAHEEMGFLLFADGNDAAALNEFSQASALNGALYLSLFAKAMLSPIASSDRPADQTALDDTLMQVLRLNPQFAPAYVQLARLDLRQDDLKSALAVSRKAEELEPWRAGYRLLSGQILLRMGRGADAAAFAKFVADRWFGPDHDEAVELWNSVPSEQRPASESLAEVIPKDTQTVSGTVQSVHCGEPATWVLVLRHDNHLLTFHRKGSFDIGFSDTIWYGDDHFTLCHHLENMRAVLRYRPASDASYAGDVAEVEIREDLPSAVKSATEKIAAPAKP